VLTLLYTGVRVSELCDIKAKNIDFLTDHLKVVGKGGKVREVPLKPEVTESPSCGLPHQRGSQRLKLRLPVFLPVLNRSE
jgi:integrase/recombinase XerD